MKGTTIAYIILAAVLALFGYIAASAIQPIYYGVQP